MKKIILFIAVFVLFGAGCKTAPPQNALNTNETAQTAISYAELGRLLATNTIAEIDYVPSFKLPAAIYPEQVKKYFKLGTYYFALYQKGSAQIFLEPQSVHDSSRESGLLIAANDASAWSDFFKIKDTSATARSNPFYIWNDGSKLFILISDDLGAGSGEGTAKLLVSYDAGQTWNIDKCFYFDYIGYIDMKKIGQINTLADYVNRYLISPRTYDSYAIQSYSYNTTTQQFYLEQFNKVTQKTEVTTQESCKNIAL